MHHQERGTKRNVSHTAATLKKSLQDNAGKRRHDKRIATILIFKLKNGSYKSYY